MNTAFGILNLVILIFILVTPFLICKKAYKSPLKNKTILSILISTSTVIILSFIFAWWTDFSQVIQLKLYGYNLDLIPDNSDRFVNVNQEDHEVVKKLLISTNGIGWPLKAIFSLMLFIPFGILTPVIYFLIKRKSSS